MSEAALAADTIFTGDIITDRIVYNSVASRSATFKSGTEKKIHGWFRLTPSFGPDLVDIMLEKLQWKKGEIVLDPFSGAGTTLIQCSLKGIRSVGFEINPLLHFVGKTSLNRNLQPPVLRASLKSIERKFHKLRSKLSGIDIEECGFELPKIHNVYRWWRKDVLKELLILKHCIKSIRPGKSYKDFLLLGLAGVLVPDLTNVTLGRLQLHFINRDRDDIRVFETFHKHIALMSDDLERLQTEYGTEAPAANLYLTDTTDIKHLAISQKANLVITSPPYPNRYSYTWNTRPHLFLLDIFDNPKQASRLDDKTIGGTWGIATTRLVKGVIEPLYPVVQEVVEPVVNKIRRHDNLMANYVMKYFNLLAKQILEMEQVVAEDIRVAYVVGNSEIKNVYVETDVLLGRIFEGLGVGYRVMEITRFRKRNSGVNLYESIVYASK